MVGDGFGSLIFYSTAVYLGFTPEEITIYGPSDNPVGTYQQFAYNLGQTVLRSESESHFLPADWPTFGQLDAWSHRSIAPLLRSARRKYNPGVPDILAEAGVVAERLNWNGSRVPKRVGWLQREADTKGTPHFVLYDEEANYLGRAKHVMLALGHGPLSFPPLLAKARQDPRTGDRIVQAYEPKQYAADGRYIVLGAGIASINEWANIIDAGGKCIALRRNPAPDEQDLNVPRCLFDGSGIDAFQGLSFDARLDFLAQSLKGTSPARRGWGDKIRQGRQQGLFEEVIGTVEEIRPGPAGLRVRIRMHNGQELPEIDVTGIVCGTGFVKSAFSLPLLRRLAQTYNVPVERERIRLKTNCGVPPLDRDDSRLAMMGLNANTVVPNGDTIAGLKYIARRFVGDCARAEGVRPPAFPSRVAMQLGLARDTTKAIRHVRKSEQLA